VNGAGAQGDMKGKENLTTTLLTSMGKRILWIALQKR
jgi:hypothetical protein